MKKNGWKNILKNKRIFAGLFASSLGIIAIIFFTFWLFYSYVNNFSRILEDHSLNQELNSAFSSLQSALDNYVWNRNDTDCEKAYFVSVKKMEQILEKLPTDYEELGRARYLKTMSVIYGYEGYKEKCDTLLTLPPEDPNFADRYYDCIHIASYIQLYIDRLTDITLQNGNTDYHRQLSLVHNLAFIWLALGCFLLICLYLYVNFILSLREQKQEMIFQQELQKKELLQIQTEQRLNEIQIHLLRSQINPHFLFNTLSLMAGMAQIENADNTKEMARRLGNIFRYNLKTESNITSLFSEINIAKDYLYIQKCRFGARVQLFWDIQVEPSNVFLPALTIQPLLENSILHGISPKEEGGIMRIRVFQRDGWNSLSIVDNGCGISREKLFAIKNNIKNKKNVSSEIGLANVITRFQMLYPKSTFKIYSKPDHGTAITIKWKHNFLYKE